jgi:Photosynthesis system II assembly factor YCF48
MRLASALLLGLVSLAQGEETAGWRLQYFYDEAHSTFLISDLKFPSAKRGIAVGAIAEGKSLKPMSALTTDGGVHWTLVPLKEPGESLFFLNDGLGWMVTTKGLWQTEESGRSWRKLKAPAGLERVHFADPEHGWAVGIHKQIYETKNGGAEWTELPAAAKVNSSKEHTQFAWIEFANKDVGLIGGWSKPPRRGESRIPDWLDPEEASLRREWPHLGILLDTRDGGKTWTPSTMSLFGQITTAKLSPEGWGLGLIEFSDAFDWPSEVFFLNWKAGKQKRVYREKDRKVTDIAIAGPAGPVYLGAVEHFGKLQQLPIPRKVKILRSDDVEHWTEMPVDYRAIARRVILAAAGPNDVWAATDTGMILKLAR